MSGTRNNLDYMSAMHGVQAGVGLAQQRDPAKDTRKDLRVGINSAMINDAAVARLLIEKGVFTEAEYAEAVRVEANRELDSYEDRLSNEIGTRIVLR